MREGRAGCGETEVCYRKFQIRLKLPYLFLYVRWNLWVYGLFLEGTNFSIKTLRHHEAEF